MGTLVIYYRKMWKGDGEHAFAVSTPRLAEPVLVKQGHIQALRGQTGLMTLFYFYPGTLQVNQQPSQFTCSLSSILLVHREQSAGLDALSGHTGNLAENFILPPNSVAQVRTTVIGPHPLLDAMVFKNNFYRSQGISRDLLV